MRNVVIRIKPGPGLKCFDHFIELAGDVHVILFGDVESLAFADAVAKLVRLLDVLLRDFGLLLISVVNTDSRVSHRKVRIEFNGALVES